MKKTAISAVTLIKYVSEKLSHDTVVVEGHKSGNIKDTKLVKCRASTIQVALSS